MKSKYLKFSFSFFFLLLYFFVYPQINYIDYHKSILNAKQALIDSNYTLSLKIFDKTFNEYEFVFIRDCFLATQIAHYLNQDSLTFVFLKIGVKHGLMLETITKDKVLSSLQKNKQWNNFLNVYDSLRGIYIHSINWDLRMKCFDMFIKDQDPISKSYIWYNLPFRRKFKKRAEKLNQEQVIVLKEIIKKYGFPSNKIIGIGDNTIDATNVNENLSNMFAVYILYHYPNAWKEMNEILFECVKRGELDPIYYAIIRDFDEIYHVNRPNKRKPYYNYMVQNNNCIEHEDEHRLSIGLTTVKQNRELIKLYFKLGFTFYPFMF